MRLFHCYKCDERKPRAKFSKDSSRRLGVSSKCKTCANKALEERRCRNPHQQERRAAYNRTYVMQYFRKHPGRAKAHRLVARALKSGALVKGICKICNSSLNVEGHHKDYRKPLNVIWLCKPHHYQADKKLIEV